MWVILLKTDIFQDIKIISIGIPITSVSKLNFKLKMPKNVFKIRGTYLISSQYSPNSQKIITRQINCAFVFDAYRVD